MNHPHSAGLSWSSLLVLLSERWGGGQVSLCWRSDKHSVGMIILRLLAEQLAQPDACACGYVWVKSTKRPEV